MSRSIIVHEEARIDVIDAAYYIAEDSLEAADRFADAVDAAYEKLADFPGMGTLRNYNNPKLKGMRMWAVPGFTKHLIFYLSTKDEIQILRVLHGARSLDRIFRPEET